MERRGDSDVVHECGGGLPGDCGLCRFPAETAEHCPFAFVAPNQIGTTRNPVPVLISGVGGSQDVGFRDGFEQTHADHWLGNARRQTSVCSRRAISEIGDAVLRFTQIDLFPVGQSDGYFLIGNSHLTPGCDSLHREILKLAAIDRMRVAGSRPASDFDLANCSGGNCERRVAYLKAVTNLLVDDLAWMAAQWASGGAARKEADRVGLSAILTGMGSLSYGELAGERMKLGLLLHDPEEEHDCFSDNTHASHYYDALGIRNIYLGEYERIDGKMMKGPGVSALVAGVAPAVTGKCAPDWMLR